MSIKKILSVLIVICMLITNISTYNFVYANNSSVQETSESEFLEVKEELLTDEDESVIEEENSDEEIETVEDDKETVGDSKTDSDESTEEKSSTEKTAEETTEDAIEEATKDAIEDVINKISEETTEEVKEDEDDVTIASLSEIDEEEEPVIDFNNKLLGATSLTFRMDSNYGGREYVITTDFLQSASSIRNVNAGDRITAPTCSITNSDESSKGLAFTYWYNTASANTINSGAQYTLTDNDLYGFFTGIFTDNRKSLTLQPHSDYSSYITVTNPSNVGVNGWVLDSANNKVVRKSRITQDWVDFIINNLQFSPGYGYDKIVNSSGAEVDPLSWDRNSNVTYYIKAKMVGTSVSFNLQGHGSPIDSQVVNTGDKVIKPADPTDANFTFAGWYKESTCENEWNFDTETIQAGQTSVTIFAKWEEKYNTVNFHMGSGESISVDNPYKRYYTQTFTIPTPTKTGYDFEGWYDNSGLTGTSITSISNNTNAIIDLYPKWNEKSYNVSFNLDGGTLPGGVSNPTSRKYTDSYNLPTPTKTGYTFKNWHKSSITGEVISSIPANTSDDISVYAEWAANQYSISYNENGGIYVGGYSPVRNRSYDETVTLPTSANISKEYFVLTGWYDNDSFSGSPVTTIAANSLVGDKTYFAKWEIDPAYAGTQVKLMFDSNGGDGTMADIPYTFYDEAEVPVNGFTKTGYSFVNWVDQNGIARIVGSKIRMTSDITLKATWAQNAVPRWNGGGSSGGSSGGSGGGGGGGGRSSDAKVGPLGDLTSLISKAKIVKNKEQYRYVNVGAKQWIKNQDGTYSLLLLVPNAKIVGLWIEDVIRSANGSTIVDVYYFDDAGKMVTGIVKDDKGDYYYFETEANENQGKMVIGWKLIDGDFYYFGADGKMLQNGTTPEGLKVDANGKLIL